MKERIVIVLALVLVNLSMLTGCGTSPVQEDIVKEETSEKIQIGMCFDSFVIERWLRDRDVFVSTAKELGAEVNVQNANGSIEEQINHIKYFIKKKVDVLVIIAVEHDSLTDVIKEAREAGIKIISYDRLIRGVQTDLYISFDNTEVGKLMAEALAESLQGSGSLFMIKGSPGDYNVSLAEQGFQEVIGNTDIKVVYSEYCDNWLAEKAYDAVNAGLDRYRNVDGVMCGNDDLANYAFRALAENRLAGKVAMVGQDADLAACQRIVEGTQVMTVYKSVEDLAKTAAEYAVSLGLGEDIGELGTIDCGAGLVPYVALMPVAVTKDNVDEIIIEGGFHSREDVYLNIKKSQ